MRSHNKPKIKFEFLNAFLSLTLAFNYSSIRMSLLPLLPLEVLDLIFGLAVTGLKSTKRDKSFSSFSLVCRSFSGVATRRLLLNLKIRNGSHINLVIDGLTRNGLGGSVRYLEIEFQKRDRKQTTIPSLPQIRQGNMVAIDDFIRLLTLTGGLTSLALVRPTFSQFRRRDISAALFSSITSFNIELYHHPMEILQDLVVMLPQVKKLAFSGQSNNNPFSFTLNFPSLRSLKILSRDIESKFMQTTPQILPASSFKGMTTLHLFGSFGENTYRENYLPLVQVAGSTLKILKLNSTWSSITYEELILFLKALPVIEVLGVCTTGVVGKDLFDHFPSSLHTINNLPMTKSQLEYRAAQKIDYSMRQIQFRGEIDVEVLKLLPLGIQKLEIESLALGKLFDAVVAGGIPTGKSGLRHITFLSRRYLPIDELKVIAFKAIGVILR